MSLAGQIVLVEKILNIISLNPRNQTKYIRLHFNIYVGLIAFYGFLLFVKLVQDFGDLDALSASLEGTGILIHYVGKLASFLLHQDLILDLFARRAKFWPIRESCQVLVKRVVWLNGFLIFAANAVLAFFMFANNGELPLVCYVPEFIPKKLFALVQYYPDILLVQTVVCFDVFFLTFSGELLIQLKLLAEAFGNIDENTRNYGALIRHHANLLGFSENLKKMVSFSFSGQYFSCILTICFELYIVSETEAAFNYMFRGLFYIFGLTIEILVYCVMSELIYDYIQNVSLKVYNTNWYSTTDRNWQKSIQLIIKRTQKFQLYSAIDVIPIGMQTFLNVFRTAFSFYTCLKTVK